MESGRRRAALHRRNITPGAEEVGDDGIGRTRDGVDFLNQIKGGLEDCGEAH